MYKPIWKEHQAVYQKSLQAFFQAPLLFCSLPIFMHVAVTSTLLDSVIDSLRDRSVHW